MKTFSAITTLLAFATAAVAAPSDDRVEMRSLADMNPRDYAKGVIEVRDERFPGRVFSGSLESIYHEMREARPDLVGDIAKRGASLSRRDGEINCLDEDRIGSWSFCFEGSIFLEELGDARCTINGADTRRSLEGRQSGEPVCGSVSCSRGCNVVLCVSENNPEYGIRCGDIPGSMQDIANECVTSIGTLAGTIEYDTYVIALTGSDC